MVILSHNNNMTFALIVALLLSVVAAAKPYEERVPNFSRLKSNVSVRFISNPTLANLDYAAYDCNPVLTDLPAKTPKIQPSAMTRVDLTFGGALESVAMSGNKTPLTIAEKECPLAWKPFIKHIWDVVKDDRLAKLGNLVSSYKWADSSVYQPYQEINAVYIHDNKNVPELWVKVEFAPWAYFFSTITDEDGDGIREIYGKLKTESVNPDSLSKIITWVKNEYTAVILNKDQAMDWVTDLASYWYPTRNTDIIDIGSGGRWPDELTKKKIKREMGKLIVNNPLAVIEGKPVSPDKPIYNVFILNTEEPSGRADKPEKVLSVKKDNSTANVTVADFLDNVNNASVTFTQELKQFGPYRKWESENHPFFTALGSWLGTFPPEQMGIEGRDGWLFFRKSVEYLLGGDLNQQNEMTNPIPHIVAFKNYLQDKGIDLLFVAIPNKEDVYFDRFGASVPAPKVNIINPYGRKLLASLQQAGVEVIDLLPLYLQAKASDPINGEYLYQKQDTHWSSRGLGIAAKCIADRIKKYSWYTSYKDTVAYTMSDTMITRLGDIVERLPSASQTAYSPVIMPARRVLFPNGTGYQGNQPASPVLLIGDSFTGVFELIDCKSAGVGAHIAARCRLPVDIITSWGGGPMVRQKMLRVRGNQLDQKKVVIYMMVMRDLYNYSQGWELLRSNVME